MAKSLFFAGLILLAAYPGAALAESKPKQIGTFNDWSAFVLGEGKAKTCYIVGRPKASLPKGTKRGDVYLLVSHRPAEKVHNEVSVNPGYAYKKDAKVDLAVGDTKFEFVVFDKPGYLDSAWAPSPAIDTAVTEAMAKGSQLVIKGTSAHGTQTIDTYSLSGVTAALKAISDACK